MRKENENINIFIIEEEYRRSKKKQNSHDIFLGKTDPLVLNEQSHESVIQELEKMHSGFEADQEDEILQEPEGTKQTETVQTADSSNSISDLDLLASLQKMRAEEQVLLEQKQRLLATQQDLYDRLFKEMDRKKSEINSLMAETQDLENTCNELSKMLGETSD
jgi:hypothetical protein